MNRSGVLPDRGQRPLAVALCGAFLLSLGFACIFVGIGGLLFSQSAFEPVADQETYIRWFPLLFGVLDILAAASLLRGSRRGPMWTLICSLFSMATIIAAVNGVTWWDMDAVLDGSRPTALQNVLSVLSLNQWGTLLFIPAFLIGIKLIDTLLFDTELRRWTGSLIDENGFAPPKSEGRAFTFWVRIGTSATVLFLLWNGITTVLTPVADSLIGWIWMDGYGQIGKFVAGYGWVSLPFLGAMGFVLWQLTEKIRVDDSGLRLFLFSPRYTILSAKWDRVRSVQIVRHGKKGPTAVVYYRTWLRLPASFRLDSNRIANGRAFIETVLEAAKGRGLPVREYYSPDWMPRLAWSSIALGMGFIVAEQLYISRLYAQFSVDSYPFDKFDRIAGLYPVTALYLASIVAISAGLGILTAHRRGGPNTIMLCAWLCSIEAIPSPMIHYLVWSACYSILCAIQTPFRSAAAPMPSMPPMHDWNLAMSALILAPAIGALGYWAGLGLGRRRRPPSSTFSPSEAKPRPFAPKERHSTGIVSVP